MARTTTRRAAAPVDENAHGLVFVTVEGHDYQYPMTTYGLTMDSTEEEAIEAIQGAVNESRQSQNLPEVNLSDPDGDVSYQMRKMVDNGNLMIGPKTTAGSLPCPTNAELLQRIEDLEQRVRQLEFDQQGLP